MISSFPCPRDGQCYGRVSRFDERKGEMHDQHLLARVGRPRSSCSDKETPAGWFHTRSLCCWAPRGLLRQLPTLDSLFETSNPGNLRQSCLRCKGGSHKGIAYRSRDLRGERSVNLSRPVAASLRQRHTRRDACATAVPLCSLESRVGGPAHPKLQPESRLNTDFLCTQDSSSKRGAGSGSRGEQRQGAPLFRFPPSSTVQAVLKEEESQEGKEGANS